jgi:hypothetical protein
MTHNLREGEYCHLAFACLTQPCDLNFNNTYIARLLDIAKKLGAKKHWEMKVGYTTVPPAQDFTSPCRALYWLLNYISFLE